LHVSSTDPNLRFDAAAEFDRWLGTPGLHRLAPAVQAAPRRSVLPPELFACFERDSLWQSSALPAGLRVI
jgi:sulfotransferase